MDVKTVKARVEIKDAAKGEFEIVFSTLGVRDAHGDVTLPGAFENGADVVVSAYGHASWGFWSAAELPVGDAKIVTTDTEAQAHGRMFLDTTGGRDTFTTVKRLAEKSLGEWSYGYDAEAYEFGKLDDQDVRFLKKVKVYEVSPVLLGAGVNTRTLVTNSLAGAGFDDEQVARVLTALGGAGVASGQLADRLKSCVDALAGLVAEAQRVGALRAEKGKPLSGKLRELLTSAQAELIRLADLASVDAPAPGGLSEAQHEQMRYLRSLHMMRGTCDAVPGAGRG